MKKILLLPLFLNINTIFAALPVIGMLHGETVSGSGATAEEAFAGNFSIIGDSEKTPFKLQITLKNCRELKDRYGKTLPLTSVKLKYKNAKNGGFEESANLRIAAKGQNCFGIIEFYNDVQERYDMELWISWDNKKANAGTFYGDASFKILPK